MFSGPHRKSLQAAYKVQDDGNRMFNCVLICGAGCKEQWKARALEGRAAVAGRSGGGLRTAPHKSRDLPEGQPCAPRSKAWPCAAVPCSIRGTQTPSLRAGGENTYRKR